MRTAPLVFLAACSCPDESVLDDDSDPFDTEPGAETDAAETDPSTDLPGESGDDSACPDDCEAVVGALDGLRWELPCLEPAADPRVCVTTSFEPISAVVAGEAGALYDVTLRFRGVVEERMYLGGERDGSWYVGGDEPDAEDPYNVYRLDVSDPAATFYVNAGASGLFVCSRIDLTRTVRVAAGATLTLSADTQDDRQIANRGTNGEPILVPGVPPAPEAFDGQFVQMDVVGLLLVEDSAP